MDIAGSSNQGGVWAAEITRELYHVYNLVWYIKASLTLDNEYMSKINNLYLGQDIPPRHIMADIDRHPIYPSIVEQARKTYNEMFRVYSGRVVVSSGEYKNKLGYIVCFDVTRSMFRVHLDFST